MERGWPYEGGQPHDVFKFNKVDESRDVLLRMHSNSERYKSITKSVSKAAETKKMEKAFDNDMERSGFFPVLRHKIRQINDEAKISTTAEMR